MALNLNLSSSIACSKLQYNSNQQFKPKFLIKCEAKDSSSSSSSGKSSKEELKSKLEIGSPVIVIEAPKMIKTAATVPCLRVNSGLVNPGDVGRYNYIHTYTYIRQLYCNMILNKYVTIHAWYFLPLSFMYSNYCYDG